MREAVELEKEFIRDCLPVKRRRPLAPTSSRPTSTYIADRRLEGCGLAPLVGGHQEPPAVARRDDGHQARSRTSSRAASPNTRRPPPSPMASRSERAADRLRRDHWTTWRSSALLIAPTSCRRSRRAERSRSSTWRARAGEADELGDERSFDRRPAVTLVADAPAQRSQWRATRPSTSRRRRSYRAALAMVAGSRLLEALITLDDLSTLVEETLVDPRIDVAKALVIAAPAPAPSVASPRRV